MMAAPGMTSQPDFTRPIALMMDCHRRIERFLDALRQIVERFGGGDLDDEGRRALETSLNYFGQAVPRHTADEEQSLLPRLRRSGDLGARQAVADLDRLEADHRLARSAHAQIEALGRRWLTSGRLEEEDGASLRGVLNALAAAYADHIHLEDQRVFVLALQSLPAESIREIGQEMECRRLENPGREGSRCAVRRRQKVQPS